MPNGRMAPDGEFGLGYSEVSPYRRYFFTQQFLPWLQGTYRYTAISYLRYGSGDFAQNQSYKDKAVDVKIRLVREGRYVPDLSLGFRDIGGTGLFSSEYLAATRRIYDFDITTGLAWGNMGSRGGLTNPFGYFSDRFKDESRTSRTTGTIGSAFFSGEEVAPYAAVEWYPSSLPNLSLKAEFDGNNYQSEPFGAVLDTNSPLNFGLVYRPFSWVDLAASYERGNTVGLRVILHSNFNASAGVPKVDEKPPFPVPLQAVEQPRQEGLTNPVDVPALVASAGSAGVRLASVDLRAQSALFRTMSIPTPEALASAERNIYSHSDMEQFDTISFVGPDGQLLRTLTGLRTSDRSRSDLAGQDSAGRLEGAQKNSPPTIDNQSIKQRVFAALKAIDMRGEAFFLKDKRAYLKYSQALYRDRDEALIRASRALAAAVPDSVEVLDLSEQEEGVVVKRAVFLKRDIALAANYQRSFDEAWVNASTLDTQELVSGWSENAENYPDYSWGLSPKLRQSVGGPDNFYLYQIYGSANGEVRFNKNFSVDGSVGANIKNNFDNFTYEAPSELPRVRTKIKDYLKGAPVWIGSLNANYINQIDQNLYYRLSAGVFEWMYSGVGGEVLYKKPEARWALGLDANYVWQRDFDGGFGLLDYSTAVGNLTYYQDLPFWDLNLQLSVGRYLAGDVGATLTLSRLFKNGVRVGVWGTKTNVSAEQFGEGSFDKGFKVSIPFSVFSTRPSTSSAEFAFAPLTRDGGQKVITPKPLYSTLFQAGGS